MRPKKFLELDRETRAEILTNMSVKIGYPADVLEKDIWICWALEKLFSMPKKKNMVFKGGTSLSKAYNLIDRFSEDIDVTIDLFSCENIDLTKQVSRSQAKKTRERLERKLKEYRDETLVPYFQKAPEQDFGEIGEYAVTTAQEGWHDTGDHLFIQYPSALSADGGSAVKRRIQFDLGARNLTEPSEFHEITTYLSRQLTSLEFPIANTDVLDPKRTFWEKVTHIHSMCQENDPKTKFQSQSRHWYDVSQIYEHTIGEAAISDKLLMESVVSYKKTHRYDSKTNYDFCLAKNWTLVPKGLDLEDLRKDYGSMNAYFLGQQPSFDSVMTSIRDLQSKLNG